MTFARGATLTTATTFGHADTSNLGPTTGNEFLTRWPDDLALLRDLGITDLRLTLDWARLQPKPGDLALDWVEIYEQILSTAASIGLEVWATLHDGAEPRWVTNEGGIHDVDVASAWWPRWVERAADRFGEHVAGWVPFARIDPALPDSGWAATWAVLGGGAAPVVASLPATDPDAIADYLDTSDRIGLVLAHRSADDGRLDELGERLNASIRECAEAAADTTLIITQFTPDHDDPDIAGTIVEQFVHALDSAIGDGVDCPTAFLDPAIAGPDSTIGLLAVDRQPTPAARRYLDDYVNLSLNLD